MDAIFHNYKQLLKITKKDTKLDKSILKEELESIPENKPEDKILFYGYSKKWPGFIYPLHNEDRLL